MLNKKKNWIFMVALLGALGGSPKTVSNSVLHDRVIEVAGTYLGMPYSKWGRMSQERNGIKYNPYLDCLGLVFLSYAQVYKEDWTKYPKDPSALIDSGLLGEPVDGLNGILRTELDPSKLQKGDILYFMPKYHKINDKPIAKIDGVDYWPNTVGLYIGDNNVIHTAPNKVRIDRLEDMFFDALLVTRRP